MSGRLVKRIAKWLRPYVWHRDALLIVVLVATGVAFAGLWYLDVLRLYLVPIGAALGTLFGAIPGLLSPTMRGKIIPAVLASAFVGVGTWYTTFDLEHEKRSLETRVNLFRQDLVTSAKGLSEGERSDLVLKFAGVLRQRLAELHFDHVDDLSNVILQLRPSNGHGLYFSGEIWRIRKEREQMRGQFNRYLSTEKTLPEDQRMGFGDDCYKRPEGFCAERTAWIEHMMAHDFYQLASETKDQHGRLDALRRSYCMLKDSLFRFPRGFDRSTSFHSTAYLRDRVRRELVELEGEPAATVSQKCEAPQ